MNSFLKGFRLLISKFYQFSPATGNVSCHCIVSVFSYRSFINSSDDPIVEKEMKEFPSSHIEVLSIQNNELENIYKFAGFRLLISKFYQFSPATGNVSCHCIVSVFSYRSFINSSDDPIVEKEMKEFPSSHIEVLSIQNNELENIYKFAGFRLLISKFYQF